MQLWGKNFFFSNLKYNKAQGLLILVVQKLQTFLRHFILIGQAGGIWQHQLFIQFKKKNFFFAKKKINVQMYYIDDNS